MGNCCAAPADPERKKKARRKKKEKRPNPFSIDYNRGPGPVLVVLRNLPAATSAAGTSWGRCSAAASSASPTSAPTRPRGSTLPASPSPRRSCARQWTSRTCAGRWRS
ncbi:unnamed protein product [Musa banksii]